MAAAPKHNRKHGNSSEDTRDSAPDVKKQRRDNNCCIFIIGNKIPAGHLKHLKNLAAKKNFPLVETFSEEVTHIVTNLSSYDKVISLLHGSIPAATDIVSLEWLTQSFLRDTPIDVTDVHRLKKPATPCVTAKLSPAKQSLSQSITTYECQRPTSLQHHNQHITESLELLERYYQYLDYKQGDTRALAFRQASCTIKALPRRLGRADDISNFHRIGKHSQKVIEEIIDCGSSEEVERVKDDAWFQCMELFTGIYGVGVATADKWYKRGLRTIGDVRECEDLKLSETQQLGIQYYDDISRKIPREEVGRIIEYVTKELDGCCPGISVEGVGGYRRGKPQSHDVDILLTHESSAATLLDTVLKHLETTGVLVHSDAVTGRNTATQVQHNHDISSQSTYNPDGRQRRSKFDHLDKAFCILKLPRDMCMMGATSAGGMGTPGVGPDGYVFRRVDFIVAPPEQYPFALVSWTGSKRKFIPAKTEKDIFDILKLNYLEPTERNC